MAAIKWNTLEWRNFTVPEELHICCCGVDTGGINVFLQRGEKHPNPPVPDLFTWLTYIGKYQMYVRSRVDLDSSNIYRLKKTAIGFDKESPTGEPYPRRINILEVEFLKSKY